MLGAIAGDIIGSTWEFKEEKPEYDFELFPNGNDFTDDSVLTVAVADAILNEKPFDKTIREYGLNYPGRGYGGLFRQWIYDDTMGPYYSFGNGSAMRVSPIGWAYDSLEETLIAAKESSRVTHNHPEGIKGAAATASAVFLARTTKSKEKIREFIEDKVGYNIEFDLSHLIENYKFDVTSKGTVPQAVFTFLISDSFEDSIRKAMMIGGDSDTLTCINGGIGEAYYGLPDFIKTEVNSRLDSHLTKTILKFRDRYIEN